MRVCAADELAPGQMIGATLDDRPIVVMRTRAGELQAYVDRCLHQGARLSGGRLLEAVDGDEVGDYRPGEGDVIKCPWHGYEYDAASGCALFDRRRRLRPSACARRRAGSWPATGFRQGREETIATLINQEDSDMALQLGDTAPDFEAQTTEGPIRFHDWIGDSWAVLFSHPRDFTPVCTTELGYMAKVKPEFERRGVKIIGLSVDPVENHGRWSQDIEETQGHAPNYPMIGDADFKVSKLYGMLPPDVDGDPTARTPAQNQTVRNVFVIAPDKTVKLILVYPMTTGRNFDEVLRVVDSLQLTAKHKVATPVNWQQGDDVIIAGSVSDEQARDIFGEWDSPRPYIRIVPQPA